uniref:Uncharacterized protein n=1 Tax=Anguilla anguilla TaxID=7936 RepID=A0A0E9PTV6_ANGAN
MLTNLTAGTEKVPPTAKKVTGPRKWFETMGFPIQENFQNHIFSQVNKYKTSF